MTVFMFHPDIVRLEHILANPRPFVSPSNIKPPSDPKAALQALVAFVQGAPK